MLCTISFLCVDSVLACRPYKPLKHSLRAMGWKAFKVSYSEWNPSIRIKVNGETNRSGDMATNIQINEMARSNYSGAVITCF